MQAFYFGVNNNVVFSNKQKLGQFTMMSQPIRLFWIDWFNVKLLDFCFVNEDSIWLVGTKSENSKHFFFLLQKNPYKLGGRGVTYLKSFSNNFSHQIRQF